MRRLLRRRLELDGYNDRYERDFGVSASLTLYRIAS